MPGGIKPTYFAQPGEEAKRCSWFSGGDSVKETHVAHAILEQPGKGRTVAGVGDVYRFLATGEDTNGQDALLEALVPPGGGPPPHVHSRKQGEAT